MSTTVVQLVEIVLVHILYVGVFDDIEILPNVVAPLGLNTTSNRTVAMVIIVSFTVVVVIVVALIRWLIVMVSSKVASSYMVVVDIIVLIGNLHLCLLL